MNEIYKYITEKRHLALRRQLDINLPEEFSAKGLDAKERATRRFEIMCKAERAVLLPGEKICFTRTVEEAGEIHTEKEILEIKEMLGETGYMPESGHISNLTPDYGGVMEKGLTAISKSADDYGKREIKALLDLTSRYRLEAERQGKSELANVLSNVPANKPRSFYEALQFCRIIHFACILDGCHHVTIGRFDKYMYPYFKADIENGKITVDEAYKLIREFFLSFNKDSDIYSRIQLGDNGQSLVLGGCDGRGGEIFNELTRLCLRAAGENMLIDPKINLRVSSKTPSEVFELGTELTKLGLGFPQYSNDDIVIPALIDMGYDEKDAQDYVVAACWEFIIPGKGRDIPNIKVMRFAHIIDTVLHRDLESAPNFEAFKKCVKDEIFREADKIHKSLEKITYNPSPFMNMMLHEKDISNGGRYNNLGIHGSGIATAADSLAAIKLHVFDNKTVTAKRLIKAVDTDFSGENELLHLLRFETPKMGQQDELPDSMAAFITDAFADAFAGRINSRGGIYRPGTGTAMYYLWDVEDLPASPDGRRKGEPLAANFSPSLFAKTGGPMSVIKSFTRPNLKRVCNGGPLTLEFHAGMFDSADSIKKVAALVKAYIDMGGHQLQLNSVNLKALKDAQINPQDHKNLIVRIWGWSAYFIELDKPYQDHVISRQEYTV